MAKNTVSSGHEFFYCIFTYAVRFLCPLSASSMSLCFLYFQAAHCSFPVLLATSQDHSNWLNQSLQQFNHTLPLVFPLTSRKWPAILIADTFRNENLISAQLSRNRTALDLSTRQPGIGRALQQYARAANPALLIW